MYGDLVSQQQEKECKSLQKVPVAVKLLTTSNKKVSYMTMVQTTCQITSQLQMQTNVSCQVMPKKVANLQNSQKPAASYKNNLVSQSPNPNNPLILIAVNYLTQKIYQNKTLLCRYLYFHIPFSYICSFVLARFQQGAQETFYYQMFSFSIKRINQINNQEPAQLQSTIVIDVVTDCLTFYKHREDSDHYLRQLTSFLQQHQEQMASFMPLYYSYFNMIAHFSEVFVTEPMIAEVLGHIKRLEEGVRQKFHRVDF